ncbi:MAG: hypothetical protein ACYC2Y_02510 [Armatimonadota bacterium]
MKSNKGSALLTGVMVLMMVSMLGLAYISLSSTNLVRANRDDRRATTFHLAEGALEYCIAGVIDRAQDNNGHITSWTYDSTSLLSAQIEGATGTVTVTPDSGLDTYATILSTATYRGITEQVRVRIKIRNVGIWNNAIFAGIGQVGRGINGNVDVRGSVHILGEGEPYTDLNGDGGWDAAETYTDANHNGSYDSGENFTDSDGNGVYSPAEPYQDDNGNGAYDPPLTATDLAETLSGAAYMGNNYDGMPEELRSKVPALVHESIGGEMVETLNAELRVKHGRVNISGSAAIGDPNSTGNSLKETVDGAYVSDGYGGSRGSSSVYSDNGSSQGYDLGDRISFPSLLSPYTDPSTGISYSTYEAYLDGNSLNVPASKIDTTVAAFSYSDGTNSISWNMATRTLTIQGIVRLPGDLDLGVKDSEIYYSGRGTLFCKGDIRVHCDVLPVSTFPTTDVMGCISRQSIYFATGSGESQIQAAGAWYAQNRIVSAKQSQFAGTYVANYFDLGTNVPNIYQVPSLTSNLPPGMPGGNVTVVVVQTLSWKRL